MIIIKIDRENNYPIFFLPCLVLFANDIILINETQDGLNDKFEQWSHTLQSRDFKLSWSKTEYLRCGSSAVEVGSEEVTIRGVVITKVEKFKYVGSIIEMRGDVDNDSNHCIRVEW